MMRHSDARPRTRLPFLVVALALVAFAAACGPRVIRKGPSMPAPMSLRSAWEALPGAAGDATVVPLDENATAWAARWQLLAEAEHTIEASYFIIEADVFGYGFLAHLYKKALEGVKVRLLLDGRGCLPVLGPGRAYLEELVSTGNVEIGVHNPAILGVAAGLLTFDTAAAIASSHDKIIVIDSRKAIVGGRNIAANYFVNPAVDPTATIDADVILEGESAAEALRAKVLDELAHARELTSERSSAPSRRDELLLLHGAMDAWLRMDAADPRVDVEAALAVEGLAISALEGLPSRDARERVRLAIHDLVRDHELRGVLPFAETPRFQGGVRILGVSSRSRGIDYALNASLLQTFAGTQRELLIETPYFVLTKPALGAFEELARRGVHITVLTNSPTSADNAASQALFVDEWPEVMARVPTMRLFVLDGTRLLHAKRMVADDTVAMVGTYNLDPLSARVNAEVLAAVWSPAFAKGVRGSMESLLTSANAIEYRISRDDEGKALRHPVGHLQSGKVMVLNGPEHHVPTTKLERLRALKGLLTSTASFWDFEVAVW